jgi:hypothetical protein
MLGLYFSGHLNIEAVLMYLSANSGLNNAAHVLLSGSSAGGIGTFTHADYLQVCEEANSRNCDSPINAAAACVVGIFTQRHCESIPSGYSDCYVVFSPNTRSDLVSILLVGSGLVFP